MSLYKIVDHRAPAWAPHNEESHLVGMGAEIAEVLIGSTAVALFVGLLFVSLQAALIPLAVLALVWLFHTKYWKHIYKIPRAVGLEDHHINGNIQAMQRIYRDRPDLRGDIDPILTSAYKYAVKLDEDAVRKRRELVDEFARAAPKIIVPPDPDLELEDFQNRLEVRKQMIKDGLL